ncbi:hypothetical protein LG290_05180 [Halomonas sediminis]
MIEQRVRIDLADGSAWYFHADDTPEKRAYLILDHVRETLENMTLKSDDARYMPNDQLFPLLQKLAYDMDFANGLLEIDGYSGDGIPLSPSCPKDARKC